ncbi:MAG TPA: adenylate/guanylate cyclase domain-containing protein [Mycobacteriales bacterium]|nr:adenylate/guanylate cyclase domain-containing protein [Mycobacteriales bacterium]
MIPADLQRLTALLESLGGTSEEVREAVEGGTVGALAVELVLRDGQPPVTPAEAAADAGIEPSEFQRFWQVLGLPELAADRRRVPADLAVAMPLVARATQDWLGEETAVGLARVIGTTTARLAEAVVDAFRVDFELPELSAGTSYADVIANYVELTRLSFPNLEALVAAVLKAHLVRVAAAAWVPDVANLATRRDLFVGFVDLAGYTALARTLAPRDLARLVSQFEATVGEVVSTGGGRLVKLIGDGAMFVADSAAAGCAIALEISRRLEESETLPPARIGADCGQVLSLYGDYFGDVVNRAARLVALAKPSTVVVSDDVRRGRENTFRFDQLPPQALKGFQAPAVTYRLLAG